MRGATKACGRRVRRDGMASETYLVILKSLNECGLSHKVSNSTRCSDCLVISFRTFLEPLLFEFSDRDFSYVALFPFLSSNAPFGASAHASALPDLHVFDNTTSHVKLIADRLRQFKEGHQEMNAKSAVQEIDSYSYINS